MLTLTAFTANKEDLITVKTNILIFVIYAEVVRDSI